MDIGCGFGGFMFHALEHYGACRIGLNTTPEQVTAVPDRNPQPRPGRQDAKCARPTSARWTGSTTRWCRSACSSMPDATSCAQVVKAHADFLKPGGLGMLHFIGHVGVRDTEFYIRKHVFPGGWIPSLARNHRAMEECGLEVVDIENLRRHYASDAGCLGRALRSQLGHDPGARPGAVRRAVSAGSGAPICMSCAEMFRSASGQDAPVPDRVQQGQCLARTTIR